MITVAGGGLAGCEAAWQLAERGFSVQLVEMRPLVMTPAHRTDRLAEVVCSNSFGADNRSERVTAGGILKSELEMLGSLIMKCARETSVPAGGALAVDRESFSALVTERITSHPNIHLVRAELTSLPDGPAIVATGPLTSTALADALAGELGQRYIAFYDAVAPIVTRDSIDMDKAFIAGRYGRGEGRGPLPGGDYINCPMTKEEYLTFHDALVHAERNLPHDFEKGLYFEGCMPIEVLADRGLDTMRFGPLRPVGLDDPKTGRHPWAVVQLRQDNADGTLYNLVGFQTGLKWGEQRRVFSLIPALERAEFVRLGVMHRNTSVNAPAVLDPWLRPRPLGRDDLFLAGQLTGVEGYMESTAMGLAAGLNVVCLLSERALPSWPDETAIGSLLRYLRTADPAHFQPMNANLGIFPPMENRVKDKRLRAEAIRDRAAAAMKRFLDTIRQ
ncbi:MAG: methylenetetrahydrofolate--tRNA-(uracil(54)-C(5))-methyltransferase (FADH(2)-oxidizing) TrmFO [Synergistaceae bacterium]|nr:methylenetetrahydrofolate--tRNA-(uracil(54)-C(5))-methyltransferase (FADH(2)-oxidizing) TrmFO [Synergistaceae bacterium]